MEVSNFLPFNREKCCDEDYGGSHYHCSRCGKTSSMMGHYSAWCKKTKDMTENHFCCPGSCELEND